MKQRPVFAALALGLLVSGCAAEQPASTGSSTTAPAAGSDGGPPPGSTLATPSSSLAPAGNDQLAESLKIGKRDATSPYKSVPHFVDRFNKLMNYQPTEAVLEASKGLVSQASGLTGPESAAEEYRSAFDIIFNGGGAFRETLTAFGHETFKKWYATRNEKHPYEIKLSLDPDNRWVFTDNSYLNSVPDDPVGTMYNVPVDPTLINPSPGINKDEAKWLWKFPGNAPLVKLGSVPNS